MPNDIPSPIDLRLMSDAVEWQATALSKRPWRIEFFAAIAQSVVGTERILELGSGPGFLAEHLLQSLPTMRMVLLDSSSAMHELACQRLGLFTSRVEFVERDFKASTWSAGLGQFDAVVTNQAVHELRHKQNAAALHRQVRSVLRPAGVYLVSDHFAGDQGMKDRELYMTVDEQRDVLKAAGFSSVKEVLRKGGMVLHCAH